MTWIDYAEQYPDHTVIGTICQWTNLWSPQLRNGRDILVALPPGYQHDDRHYPVIYMHDGQNLFDDATSYAGEWHVDETMLQLSREGLAAIVVGIPNAGVQRIYEYNPFADRRFGQGKGDLYLSFIVQTVKPLIDRSFRTLPDRRHTGIVGSSLGGLISLYAFFRYAGIFGFGGALSPSLWFAQRSIYPFVERSACNPGRLYLDVGGREDPGAWRTSWRPETSRTLLNAREMDQLLIKKGYREGKDLHYVEAPDATHSESAWARRLPDALRFLLAGLEPVRSEAPARWRSSRV